LVQRGFFRRTGSRLLQVRQRIRCRPFHTVFPTLMGPPTFSIVSIGRFGIRKKQPKNGDTQPRCALRIAWLGDVDLQSLNRAGYAGKLMRSYHFLRERVQ
jgi:hypothetical protein